MKYKLEVILLVVILIVTLFLTLRGNEHDVNIPPQNINISSSVNQIVQIAPNVIGIVDSGIRTGKKGQLIVLEYNHELKSFEIVTTLDVDYILNHPNEFGISQK